jgi:glutathione S-transferase
VTTPPAPATVIGSPISPFVRKVLAVCEMKGVPYRLDPIVPFFGDDRFSELNPLRRIPVFIDEAVAVSDSTVICEYLEERYPLPALLPTGHAQRARARWIEEFADTRLADVCIWRIFYEAVINPFIWQRPRDKDKIARAVAEDLPGVMADLERLAPSQGFAFGTATIADIAVAVMVQNLRWARVEPDKTRWPKVCGWVEQTVAVPGLAKVTRCAEALMQTPPDKHRTRLAELGAPLTETTVAGSAPRRGPMTV